jgi:hypothetical protein
MKTIIAGSRTITDYEVVCRAIRDSGFAVTEVVSGHASSRKVNGKWMPSVDRLGERWSREFLKKEATLFPADWTRQGLSAGHKRNGKMADYAVALVAVWDGSSRGTRGMIEIAQAKGLEIYVHTVIPEEKNDGPGQVGDDGAGG